MFWKRGLAYATCGEYLYFLVLASLLKLESLNCIPTLLAHHQCNSQQDSFIPSSHMQKNVEIFCRTSAALVVVSREEQKRSSSLNVLL